MINDSKADEFHVTVIATGFEQHDREVIPSFKAETIEPFTIESIEETSGAARLDDLAEVSVDTAGTRNFREPNLDIPTFLRKQLD